MVVLEVDLRAEMVVMLLEEVAPAEHNLQVVVLDPFQLAELQGLHFRVEMVQQVVEEDTSVAEVVVDLMVVVLMVLVEVGLLILVHHF